MVDDWPFVFFNFAFCKKGTHAHDNKKGVQPLNEVHPLGALPTESCSPESQRALARSPQLPWDSPPTPSTRVCLTVRGIQYCAHFYSLTYIIKLFNDQITKIPNWS